MLTEGFFLFCMVFLGISGSDGLELGRKDFRFFFYFYIGGVLGVCRVLGRVVVLRV